MDIRECFAVNLRRLRSEKEWSQEGLALAAGINRSYMSKLERAGTYAGLEIVQKLADVLEVDPADLIRKPPKAIRRTSSKR